jgi:hypothetical protein
VTRGIRLVAPAAVSLVLVGAAVAAATPQPPPIHIPNLPNQEVERFKVTLNGSQGSTFTFALDLPPGGCSVHSEGRLTEDWKFARGRGVIVEFRRIKGTHTVFLERKGHPPGDVSFATPGTVIRTASGFWDELGPAPCSGHHEFSVTDCDRKIPAKADMRFIWAEGKLTMEPTSKSTQRKNPAAACGSGNDNIDGLSWEYPFLAKQKGKLSAREVFGKRKHLVVPLSAGHPYMPLRQGSFIVEKEQFGGDGRLVLSRLP